MKKKIKYEKSCGGIVFINEYNKKKVLLVRGIGGHWGFPKGHVEAGETEIDTAIREIKEETNILVTIDNNFRMVTKYSPFDHVEKKVVYFIAFANNYHYVAQESEISEIAWLDFDQALSTITYESDRYILENAIEYIKSNY